MTELPSPAENGYVFFFFFFLKPTVVLNCLVQIKFQIISSYGKLISQFRIFIYLLNSPAELLFFHMCNIFSYNC